MFLHRPLVTLANSCSCILCKVTNVVDLSIVIFYRKCFAVKCRKPAGNLLYSYRLFLSYVFLAFLLSIFRLPLCSSFVTFIHLQTNFIFLLLLFRLNV
ncbi:hypothetical protein XELAEV_18038847mg [Xenopus laevis]|uniref:Uncharacterized protein n=1 Tax=Xenopus laevis TaxID=8355 RepID=A0A974H794_XENLA|nr:hypothetical protein XELAEV_18038847mg [Xenopus laevis]